MVCASTSRPIAKPKLKHLLDPHALLGHLPSEVAKLYNFAALGGQGSGQCIALIELGGGSRASDNQKACRKARIACVSIPQRGGTKTAERQAFEKSPDFKKAQRFRAGIEGRISVLFRGRGMKRCLARGKERFRVFVGVAVLANNLMKIAELLIQRENKKKPRSRAA